MAFSGNEPLAGGNRNIYEMEESNHELEYMLRPHGSQNSQVLDSAEDASTGLLQGMEAGDSNLISTVSHISQGGSSQSSHQSRRASLIHSAGRLSLSSNFVSNPF